MSKAFSNGDPESDLFPYEVDAFAEKYGVSKRAAEVILSANGPSRHKCDAAARAFVQARKMREMRKKPPAASIRA